MVGTKFSLKNLLASLNLTLQKRCWLFHIHIVKDGSYSLTVRVVYVKRFFVPDTIT